MLSPALQHFGRGLKHHLKPWLVDLANILSKVVLIESFGRRALIRLLGLSQCSTGLAPHEDFCFLQKQKPRREPGLLLCE
jgi:hypothetical protein